MSLDVAKLAAGLAAAWEATSIAVAPVAVADPVWPVGDAESAADTIADLQAQGYEVQINWVTGYNRAPLSRCSVSAIHNPDLSGTTTTSTTVYVDVVCPNDWDW